MNNQAKQKWSSVYRLKSEIAERLEISPYLLNNELQSEEVKQALKKVGYNRFQKKMSPRQMDVIIEHIGELNY